MATMETKQLSAKVMKQKQKRKEWKETREIMASEFIMKAPPKMPNHKTYNCLAMIKSKKNKWRRSMTTNLKYVDKIELEIVKGKFMETTWEETIVGQKGYPPTQALSIDGYQTLDSTDKKYIVAMDERLPSLRIFSKAPRKKARQHLASDSEIQKTRNFAGQFVEAKPEVVRGTDCGSINDRYVIHGSRPNRSTPGNGVYVFNDSVDQLTKKYLEETVEHIVEEMEESVALVEKFIHLEKSVITQVFEQTTLDSIGTSSIAFSVGKDYHSKCHADKDYHYTHLTVVGPENVDVDEVIYYFVFPNYGIRIPLRSGDTLLFNPTVLHSCSNPKYEGCYIMSAYVSRRTVLRADPVL